MTRLGASLLQDLRLQLRYGFVAAGIFVAVFWIAILSFLPSQSLRFAVPAFLFLNGTMTTLFFVAGLVLYEKREGVLEALVVTPLRHGEYLASKIATLSLLATVETLAIALLGWGSDFDLAPAVVGVVTIGVLNSLFGFLLVFHYDSINEFLLPAGVFVAFLEIPVIASLGLWQSPIFYLWPTQGALLLLDAAFDPIATPDLLYAIAYSSLWIAGLSWLARRNFARFIVRSEGVG